MISKMSTCKRKTHRVVQTDAGLKCGADSPLRFGLKETRMEDLNVIPS
jgi:hypothetical protein